ncbi:MAG: TetR family transcriptional regulator [Burkholderiaceae bacterium]
MATRSSARDIATPTRSRQGPGTRRPGVREQAAQATRESLLRAAIKVFSKHGLDGGSVEMISRAAKSHDRMIYYYFGNKEGLYIAALEEIYRRFNEAEARLDLDPQRPIEGLRAVVSFMFTYYRRNPEFVTLLNNENLHRGKHIAKSQRAREYSSPALGVVDTLLRAGTSAGVFRSGVSARDLYLMIAAMCYFYQSNRFTLSSFLGENLETVDALAHWEAFVTDAVMRTVLARTDSLAPGAPVASAPSPNR